MTGNHGIFGRLSATGPVSSLRRAGQLTLDILLPLQCVKCGTVVGADGGLCATCWPTVRFLQAPQ